MEHYNDWWEFLPELKLIEDETLVEKIIAVYEEARLIGGWETIGDVAKVPFSLQHPEFGIDLRRHVHIVVTLCENAYQVLCKEQGEYALNHDYLIAGALLHDVGKIFGFTVNEEGKFVKGKHEVMLRHCFSGAGLAIKHGLPEDVCHIIAYHSEEGIGKWRSPEAVILNKMDYLAFDILKSYFGIKQEH